MIPEKMQEFLVMLFLENKAIQDRDFYHYLNEKVCIDKFNSRYMELLDEFLNNYASNKTEKSD